MQMRLRSSRSLPLAFAALVTACLSVAATACSSTKPEGTLALTIGGESDALSRAPTPTKLIVDGIALDGAVSPITTAALPASMIDLGELDTARVLSLRVTATDATGTTLLRGLTLPVELGALASLAFPVFLQRVGEMARLPKPLADARSEPLVATVAGRYLVVAGGTGDIAKTGSLYDLALLQAYSFPAALSRAARSLAVFGTKLLVIDTAGASFVDLATFAASDVAAPSGGSFAEVAGGATVLGDGDTSYVVGATRSAGDPTSRVLRIDADVTLSFVSLAQARLGAAAAWVKGRGLVVADGTDTGAGAGVEILGPGATVAVALPYASRRVRGGAAVARPDGKVALIGGTLRDDAGSASAPSPQLIDLSCTSACAGTPFSASTPGPLAHTEAFVVTPTSTLVIGSSAAGDSVAFRIDDGADGLTPVPFRAPHTNAHAVRLYNGSIAVVGGATAVETYAP